MKKSRLDPKKTLTKACAGMENWLEPKKSFMRNSSGRLEISGML